MTAAGGGGSLGESREEVMDAPSLLETFCQRTADDYRANADENATGAPGAAMAITGLVAVLLFVAGHPAFAKAALVLLGVETLWMVWDMVVRSSSISLQKREEIRRGIFPPESASLVMARLRWWNHLVTPRLWARHTRINDRRYKLEKKIRQDRDRLDILRASAPGGHKTDPGEEEMLVAGLAAQIRTAADRDEHRVRIAQVSDEAERLHDELILTRALLHKVLEITDKLDHIDRLGIVIQDFTGADLAQVVADSLAVLEERRRLVNEVDSVNPDTFLDMVTI